MFLYESELYREDVIRVAGAELPWEKLKDTVVLISGATGLLGSFLMDVLMEKNTDGWNCTICMVGRSSEKAWERFSKWENDEHLVFLKHDVNQPFESMGLEHIDYVIHLASNTHPIQYASDPIGTIMTNIIGLRNMLDLAVSHHTRRFAFASSNEVYGENRGDIDLFDEDYCGYINSNTLRAGYPESKRCGEALCQAYRAQKGLDIVIPRFTRSYGPTILGDDSKAISQFIKKAVNGEDIVLKSAGTQNYSYTYMADAIYGFLTVLLKGESGEAYNIADEASNIMLRDLAKLLADHAGTKVVSETPDALEAVGYSKATKALLNGNKLKALGWNPQYGIAEGIMRTVDILASR